MPEDDQTLMNAKLIAAEVGEEEVALGEESPPGRPRIGVSVNFMHADPDRALFRGKTLQYVEERMVASVWRNGGVPIILPDLEETPNPEALVEEIDGLLLTGGADVSPTTYGETPLQESWAGDAVRDAYEARLLARCIERARPVFGICRGIQLINAAMGGTLWQDIQTQVEGGLVHRDWHRYDQLGHPVRIAPQSWVSRCYDGATDLAVNSIHHQSIARVAEGFHATAWAPDGVIEAIESTDPARRVTAVQWHPEWLEADRVSAPGDANGWADGARLFEAFVVSCRAPAS